MDQAQNSSAMDEGVTAGGYGLAARGARAKPIETGSRDARVLSDPQTSSSSQ